MKIINVKTRRRQVDAQMYSKLVIKGDAADIGVRIGQGKYENNIYFRDRNTTAFLHSQLITTDELIELRDFLNFALPKEDQNG
jgi:hypothetical protein